MKKFAGLTVMAFLITSCAKFEPPDTSSSGQRPNPIEADQPPILTNGLSPKKYYEQFLYGPTTTNCSVPNHIYFRYLSMEVGGLGFERTGQTVLAHIEIAMREDHSYVARYSEWKPAGPEERRYGTTAIQTLKPQEFTGHWYIEGTNITFSGLGHGFPIQYNKANAIDFLISDFALSPALNGQSVFLRNYESRNGFFDESGESICAMETQ